MWKMISIGCDGFAGTFFDKSQSQEIFFDEFQSQEIEVDKKVLDMIQCPELAQKSERKWQLLNF